MMNSISTFLKKTPYWGFFPVTTVVAKEETMGNILWISFITLVGTKTRYDFFFVTTIVVHAKNIGNTR